jgi:hypothetical protein
MAHDLDRARRAGVQTSADGTAARASGSFGRAAALASGVALMAPLCALGPGEAPPVVVPDQTVIDRLGPAELDDLLDDLAAVTLYTRTRRRRLHHLTVVPEHDACSLEEVQAILPKATARFLRNHGICYPEKVGRTRLYSRARAEAFRAGLALPPFPAR